MVGRAGRGRRERCRVRFRPLWASARFRHDAFSRRIFAQTANSKTSASTWPSLGLAKPNEKDKDMICHRFVGRSIKDCMLCRVQPWDRENGGGWLACPPEPRACIHGQCLGVRWECDRRGECLIGNPNDDGHPHNEPTQRHLTISEQGIMKKALTASSRLIASGFTGDICQDCHSVAMVRTGTCLTCNNCGSTSGGCS